MRNATCGDQEILHVVIWLVLMGVKLRKLVTKNSVNVLPGLICRNCTNGWFSGGCTDLS